MTDQDHVITDQDHFYDLLSGLDTAGTVQLWCNSCQAQPAVHQIEVDFDWGNEMLMICQECFKELKREGLM